MKKEFERYRLADKRQLTGMLQLLGSAGLFFGVYMSHALSLTASAGLALLMLLGVMVRIRIRDPLPAILPALIYALLSAYLFYDLLDF